MTTDAEWRQKLTPEQFRVLRQHGTERPFTSPLNDEHRSGVFVCAACALELFRSETKFDSGTGWPSFFAPIEGAVETIAGFQAAPATHRGALPSLGAAVIWVTSSDEQVQSPRASAIA